jgi:ribonuclease E
MVKGIAPGQPAPLSEPRPEPAAPVAKPQPGLVERLFAWLRGQRTAAPAPQLQVETATRREARPRAERTERNGERRGSPRNRRDGQRSERPERTERPERDEVTANARGAARAERPEAAERDKSPRPERADGGGRNRQGRGPRTGPKPADVGVAELPVVDTAALAETIAAAEAPVVAAGGDEGTPEKRRRRSRGRRDRRPGEEQGTVIGAAAEVAAETGEVAPRAAEAIEAVATETAASETVASETVATEVVATETVATETVAHVAPRHVADESVPATADESAAEVEAPMPVVATDALTVPAAPEEEAPLPVIAEPAAEPAQEVPVLTSASEDTAAAAAPIERAAPSAFEQVPAEAEVGVLAGQATPATVSEEPVPAVQDSLTAAATTPAKEEPIAAVLTEPVAGSNEAAAMPAAVQPVDSGAAVAESGLVMIETSRDKAATAVVDAPAQPLGRRPRPAPVIVEVPLEQVETHNK